MKLRNLYAGTALALLIVSAGPSWSQDTAQAEAESQAVNREQVEESVTAETDSQLADKRTAVIQEAVDALDETMAAIAAIEKGDTDAAIAALALATGKLETVVAREPDLALAPIRIDHVTYDVLGSVEAVRGLGKQIEDLVDDGKFQEARPLLSGFASEVVIRTTSLPLATYPDAILAATALLDDGKTDEAMTVLNAALSTQVVTDTVIALPPLRAVAMIEKAKALLNDDGKAANDKAATEDADLTAADYVEAARQELEIAEALGYGRESDFEDLHEALNELDRQIKAQEDTGGIFETIATRFKELRTRIFN
ncbi:YfdX family protein [Paracoccus sp. (in: a-proteobacteria)]|uniref:YfdX family protein n=1 Tax=Paracoccus sp. TaxID=267 RepID=UPI00289664F0|nr:YfdX family protein [Paracoccus sp. (in: a-proteobacteria)]